MVAFRISSANVDEREEGRGWESEVIAKEKGDGRTLSVIVFIGVSVRVRVMGVGSR